MLCSTDGRFSSCADRSEPGAIRGSAAPRHRRHSRMSTDARCRPLCASFSWSCWAHVEGLAIVRDGANRKQTARRHHRPSAQCCPPRRGQHASLPPPSRGPSLALGKQWTHSVRIHPLAFPLSHLHGVFTCQHTHLTVTILCAGPRLLPPRLTARHRDGSACTARALLDHCAAEPLFRQRSIPEPRRRERSRARCQAEVGAPAPVSAAAAGGRRARRALRPHVLHQIWLSCVWRLHTCSI